MPYRKRDRRTGAEPVDRDRRRNADRRQYQRILIDLEVDYQCEDTFLFAYITDMSALGIFIRTNNPEPPGTHLNLRFTLPGEQKPLQLEGEVIWINAFRPGNFENINPGMGVRFVEQTPELTDRLLELVRKIAYLDGHDVHSRDSDDEEGDEEDGDDEAGDDEAGDDEAGDDEAGDDEAGDEEAGDEEDSAGEDDAPATADTEVDRKDDAKDDGHAEVKDDAKSKSESESEAK